MTKKDELITIDYKNTEVLEKLLRGADRLEAYASEGNTTAICICADLRRAIDQLNEKELYVVKRICIDGESYRKVAKEMGRSTKYVYTLTKGAIFTLSELLEKGDVK